MTHADDETMTSTGALADHAYTLIVIYVTRTATRSCRTRKRAVHVYSPDVAATRAAWPVGTAASATSLLQWLM